MTMQGNRLIPHRSNENGQHELQPGGRFVYRSSSFAFKISQRLPGWKLEIWQRRWDSIYQVRMTFTTPVTAARYAFDFIRTSGRHGQPSNSRSQRSKTYGLRILERITGQAIR